MKESQSAAAGAAHSLGDHAAPAGSSDREAIPDTDTATSTTSSEDASIEGARHQDDHTEEDEDHDGGRPQDGSDPTVQSTAPEPEEASTPGEVVTTPANDNDPATTTAEAI
jgi:hypothetical protein